MYLIVLVVHLGKLLSSFPPPLVRAIKIADRITAAETRRSPAAITQASVPTGQEPDVRLELHQVQRRLDPADITKLVERYEAGASLAELARDFGIYKRTVYDHVIRSGIQPRPQKVLTGEQLPEIIRRYEAGATLKTLGPEFGVSHNTVRNYLLRAGITLRPACRQSRPKAG